MLAEDITDSSSLLMDIARIIAPSHSPNLLWVQIFFIAQILHSMYNDLLFLTYVILHKNHHSAALNMLFEGEA